MRKAPANEAGRGLGARASAIVAASTGFQAALYLWPAQSTRISGVVLLAAIAWSAARNVRAAWRVRGYARRVWIAAAIGMVLWLVAQALFATTEVVHNRPVGGASPGDLPNILAFVFAVLGMLLFPSAPRTVAGKLRMVLDGLLITSALFGLAWLLVLGELVRGSGPGSLGPLRLAGPMISVAVLSMALVLIAGGGSRTATALTAFCAGIAAAAGSVLASLYLDLRGSAVSDTGADGALLLAVLLIGWAPALPLPDPRERSWNPASAMGQVLPYVPVTLTIAVAAFAVGRRGALDPAIFWSGLLMIGAVLVRQFSTLRMNIALTAELEDHRIRLAHQAAHDPLTGLANRALLADRMTTLLGAPGPERGRPALLLVGLDGFKAVNDTLGHAAGDHVLLAVADRLRAGARGNDTVARLGGDEFAVLVAGVDPRQAAEVAGRVLDRLTAPVPYGDGEIAIGASIGVALARSAHRTDPDLLLREADVALYAAKSDGKGRYRMADAELSVSADRRRRLDRELRMALRGDELELRYQPIVELSSGTITGVEALVRWAHPHRGLLAPAAFLPAAQAAGLMPAIDRLVLPRACEQASAWRRLAPDLVLSVNISAASVADPALVALVTGALDSSGLPASALALELTGTALATDVRRAAAVLGELSAAGVRIALDDFGTGYSPLSFLRNLPIGTIKIDDSFVADLGSPGDDGDLVRAILHLARSLGLRPVAEGVETGAQADVLRRLRCGYGQGHYFCAPVPAREFTEILRAGSGAGSAVASGAALG